MATPVPEKRVRDFEQLGYGMFIHWGLYSQLGQGEWTQWIHKIPKEEYVKLIDSFTAKEYDAEKIVLLAKQAGMKYIVSTTRHHEGFSLYDTMGLNQYDAPSSPAKRDLIREFVDACNKHDILPLFYHTTLDWYNEDFENDFESYLDYLNRSVEILCTNYGKIGGLWFDGNWSKPDADWNETRLYQTIRKHQPDAIIVNNTGLEARGETGHPEIDSVTFEQGHPTKINREGRSKYVAAEMCYTMNAHWGIGNADFNYKSTADLIRTLCACRKVGANLLLNVGPNADGAILPLQETSLLEIGKWVDLFGESIYSPVPCDVVGSGDDFVLKGEDVYYFFIGNLSVKGNENVTTASGNIGVRAFGGLHDKIESIAWVDNDEPLAFSSNPQDGIFSFFATGYPYGMDTVVRVAKAKIKA